MLFAANKDGTGDRLMSRYMLQLVDLRYRDLPSCTIGDLESLLTSGPDLWLLLAYHYHFFLNIAF